VPIATIGTDLRKPLRHSCVRTTSGTFGEIRQSPGRNRQRLLQVRTRLRTGPHRTWKTVEDVELATLGWVHWHNTRRLHGYLNDLPPAEFEATFYATERTDQPLVEIQ